MCRLLQEVRAEKLWTAADDERAQKAMQQKSPSTSSLAVPETQHDPLLRELAQFLLGRQGKLPFRCGKDAIEKSLAIRNYLRIHRGWGL